MMGDSIFFVLFKADFSDITNIKGVLRFKCPHKFIVDCSIDRNDPKRLMLVVLKDHATSALIHGQHLITGGTVEDEGLTEDHLHLNLYFESREKAHETKDFIEFNRKMILENQFKAMYNYFGCFKK